MNTENILPNDVNNVIEWFSAMYGNVGLQKSDLDTFRKFLPAMSDDQLQRSLIIVERFIKKDEPIPAVKIPAPASSPATPQPWDEDEVGGNGPRTLVDDEDFDDGTPENN